MTKRLWFLVLLVGILVAANFWTWIDADEPTSGRFTELSSQTFKVEDFASVLPASRKQAGKSPVRDLFYVTKVRKKPKPKLVKRIKKSVVIRKSPEELLREKIEREIDALHLVGVLQREGKLQAYVSKGEQSYLVKKGDKIAEQYEVQMLTLDEIVIIHNQTKVKRTIKVSGE